MMTKNSETGHAKNVANFDSLISVINGFGAAYNPSRQSLILTALVGQSQSAKNALSLVNNAFSSYSIAIAARSEAFKPMGKLTTRILNALRSSDTTQQIDDTAKSLVRKLKGQRATPKLTEEEKTALKADGIDKKEISSSQMDFDNRIANFDKLIQLLAGITQYAPNETDLQVNTLINYYNTLNETNKAVIDTTSKLSNARLNRDELLYKTDTGLVDTAKASKLYIKSLFDATSPQYKQVSGITFKTIES